MYLSNVHSITFTDTVDASSPPDVFYEQAGNPSPLDESVRDTERLEHPSQLELSTEAPGQPVAIP